MNSGDPIIFAGPHTRPGDAERATAVSKRLTFIASELIEQHGPTAFLDGMISFYLELSLFCLGLAQTDEHLQLIRRDLPRMHAAMRARDAEPQGRA